MFFGSQTGCGHLRNLADVNVEDCKDSCIKNLETNGKMCNAFNYRRSKRICSLKNCPIPVPEPKDDPALLLNHDIEGYAIIGINSISWNKQRLGSYRSQIWAWIKAIRWFWFRSRCQSGNVVNKLNTANNFYRYRQYGEFFAANKKTNNRFSKYALFNSNHNSNMYTVA